MEVALMQSMQDVPSCPPTILRMHEFINIAPQYALVTEYLGEEWVDLFTYMDLAGPLTEETARHIFHQVISATSWLHSRNILHNDLKDENILINQVTLETKLIDFGSANAVTPSSRQFSGTRKFMSPQVLDCLENQGADWSPTDQELWSLGTLLFILLFGTDPFSDEYEAYQVDIQVKLSCIMARQSRQVSAKAAKLVEGLLERDHRRRWSLAKALGAEFWDDNQ
ncbi:kinase-like domain-containing protein [Geranomyces variabilis]|nr:kinase-like domain-containing protein [Geranomyces variabilis]